MSRKQRISTVEQALERLYRLTASRKIQDRQSSAIGTTVTRAGYNVLRCVHDATQLSLSQISESCDMDPAATGRQVRSLEEAGMLTRTVDSGDSRVTNVTLTSRGRSAYLRVVAVRTNHIGEVLSAWSAADQATLATLLNRLVDDLRATPYRPLPADEPD